MCIHTYDDDDYKITFKMVLFASNGSSIQNVSALV